MLFFSLFSIVAAISDDFNNRLSGRTIDKKRSAPRVRSFTEAETAALRLLAACISNRSPWRWYLLMPRQLLLLVRSFIAWCFDDACDLRSFSRLDCHDRLFFLSSFWMSIFWISEFRITNLRVRRWWILRTYSGVFARKNFDAETFEVIVRRSGHRNEDVPERLTLDFSTSARSSCRGSPIPMRSLR